MKVNVLLFPDFETLDAFGPVEVFGCMEEYELHYTSMSGGSIRSRQGASIVTEKLENQTFSDILLIPGGQGTRTLVHDQEFTAWLNETVMNCGYCLTVCTGSALVAKTGLLNHKKATSNKNAFEWVRSINEKVEWVNRARWVVDQKFYTSSGVSAGMDMALGFIADRFGRKRAQEIAGRMEYIWNSDSDWDQFAQGKG